MSIEIANESSYSVEGFDELELPVLARFVLDALHVHPQAELSILLVDSCVMAELHLKWMDEPGPTDVLSFPMDELRPGREGAPSSPGTVGDIVICPEVAAKQAAEAGHTAREEILLLTTHGILHLLGYDHAEPDEEREMFDLQRSLLLTYMVSE